MTVQVSNGNEFWQSLDKGHFKLSAEMPYPFTEESVRHQMQMLFDGVSVVADTAYKIQEWRHHEMKFFISVKYSGYPWKECKFEFVYFPKYPAYRNMFPIDDGMIRPEHVVDLWVGFVVRAFYDAGC